jgi:sugar lactone lactonase YvrE
MRKRDQSLAAFAVMATAVIGTNAWADVKLLSTIDIPGAELAQFDIGVVDVEAGRYYLADRSNKGVDIFDTQTNKFVGRVDGFVGVVMRDGRPVGNVSGPNGVALDSKNKVLWVGDGDSTLKAIDLKVKEPKIIASINLGGQRRAAIEGQVAAQAQHAIPNASMLRPEAQRPYFRMKDALFVRGLYVVDAGLQRR